MRNKKKLLLWRGEARLLIGITFVATKPRPDIKTIKVAALLRSLVLASGCWTLGDFGFFLGVGRFGVE